MSTTKKNIPMQFGMNGVADGLYDYSNKTTWRLYPFLDDIFSSTFEEKFLKLISGTDRKSKETAAKILGRLRFAIETDQPKDIFTQEEQAKHRTLIEAEEKEVFQLAPNLYSYKGYFLPVKEFEACVFDDMHGLHKLDNLGFFASKDILDLGAYIGDSALILSPLTNKKVYSFEAAQSAYNKLLRTIELNELKNVVPVNAAVGACNGKLELSLHDSSTSFTLPDNVESYGKETVVMTSVDSFVEQNGLDVGLIKVDIEGYEQEFLKGAMRTIREQRPVLLISIYHNMSDFFDIKPMIESWNLEYSFKIHKPFDFSLYCETMLICEPK